MAHQAVAVGVQDRDHRIEPTPATAGPGDVSNLIGYITFVAKNQSWSTKVIRYFTSRKNRLAIETISDKPADQQQLDQQDDRQQQRACAVDVNVRVA